MASSAADVEGAVLASNAAQRDLTLAANLLAESSRHLDLALMVYEDTWATFVAARDRAAAATAAVDAAVAAAETPQ